MPAEKLGTWEQTCGKTMAAGDLNKVYTQTWRVETALQTRERSWGLHAMQLGSFRTHPQALRSAAVCVVCPLGQGVVERGVGMWHAMTTLPVGVQCRSSFPNLRSTLLAAATMHA